MDNVEIRRPKMEEIERLKEFFSIVIIDTFNKEGLGERLDDIKDEIRTKENYLDSDFESNGEKRFFLIAFDLGQGKVIGSIEFGPASNLIIECTNHHFKELLEVGTVFVHPDYQRMGIGNILLTKMYTILQDNGIDEFCLDSGYMNAQRIWRKKFGEPEYWLKDYWGKGYDHMIWKIRVSDWVLSL